jgi:putative glutamine amidotransferase
VKIGLTYTGTDEKHNNYMEWLRAGDGIELIRLTDTQHTPEIINECDALVLSGGADMHPDYYNGEQTYKGMPKTFVRDRDEFELALLEAALKSSIPLLGVCRGMQLINVYLNGTLTQDLGELNKTHLGGKHDRVHDVYVEKGTLLRQIARIDRGAVNSAHHQSIKILGEGLIANCYSDDGVIEGIEWKDKSKMPFMLAVQWHPERMNKFNLQDTPLAKNIRDRFIAETISSLQEK